MAKLKTKIPQSEISKIPQLPRGEGSITVVDNGTRLKFQKSVNGNRKAVYGITVAEVFKKMKEKENNSVKIQKRKQAQILQDEILLYLNNIRKPTLKPKSYDRLITTYENQIKNKRLGLMRISTITDQDIRDHLDGLNDDGYSYSTIKKVYNMLNPFFKWYVKKLGYNPMEEVKMINKTNIKAVTKEIYFFPDNVIKAFTKDYTHVTAKKIDGEYLNLPTYRLAAAYVFDMYTGLRAGELTALRWSNVDLKRKYIYVKSTIEDISNPEYDPNNPELMDKKGINKRAYVEYETKNYSDRAVPLCEQAIEALKIIKKYSDFTSPNDYVVATKNGTHCSIPNLNTSLKRVYTFIIRKMEKDKHIEIDTSKISMQVLRHTCASLLFRHTSLRLEEIASIMGHSPEVCRKTYIHLVEERKAMGMKQMSRIDFDYDFQTVQLPS